MYAYPAIFLPYLDNLKGLAVASFASFYGGSIRPVNVYVGSRTLTPVWPDAYKYVTADVETGETEFGSTLSATPNAKTRCESGALWENRLGSSRWSLWGHLTALGYEYIL